MYIFMLFIIHNSCIRYVDAKSTIYSVLKYMLKMVILQKFTINIHMYFQIVYLVFTLYLKYLLICCEILCKN